MKYESAILKSIEYIEKNIKNQLTLKIIADQVGYSEFHFSRIFKEQMGISIMDYVQERRLILASKEIFNGRKIIDVSIDFCYETHSGFSKAFKKKFGFTPTQHLIYAINILECLKNENGDGLKMDSKTNNANVFIKSSVDFKDKDLLYKQLVDNLKARFSRSDLSIIDKAYKLACKAHEGQYRKSGEPYVTHSLNVSLILSELDVDKECIIVGLLHDTIEKHTPITLDIVEEKFSKEIKELLEAVTNFNSIDLNEVADDNSTIDWRVFIIKLADRLHNMRTIKYMDPEEYKDKAKETIEIFSPIAKRLNILKFKVELDDLSIKYIISDNVN
ncbi:HD domain-containing protein [Paeniclostridium sordellii]|nr:HD domain-containing protein [Paeniclostridium sordellii]